jgi:hypothetical protein
VTDNPNRQVIYSFYESFPPGETFRQSKRLEIHYTPKHGSWLDIAEIELTAPCLGNRRIPSTEVLNKELLAWETIRNANQKGVGWHFTTGDARSKLKRLYPVIL